MTTAEAIRLLRIADNLEGQGDPLSFIIASNYRETVRQWLKTEDCPAVESMLPAGYRNIAPQNYCNPVDTAA